MLAKLSKQNNFKINDLKIKLAKLKSRKKSNTHKILPQKDKEANTGRSVALYGTQSHMSNQEELDCLRPTVENLKEQNKVSIFKGNECEASECKT